MRLEARCDECGFEGYLWPEERELVEAVHRKGSLGTARGHAAPCRGTLRFRVLTTEEQAREMA